MIYPIVSKGSADSGQRTHLYDEHAEMKILLHTLEAQLLERIGPTLSDR